MIKKHDRRGVTRPILRGSPLATIGHWLRRSASVTACIVTNRIIVRGLQKDDHVPRIAIPKREDAPAASRPILDNVDKMLGFVPNLHRLMSISPNALFGWATLELNRVGRSSDPKRQAAVAFAKALIETRGKVSDAQFAAVRDAGWTDGNIVEMIALTAQFLLTNFMNNAVQTPIDFPEVSPAKAA
jgi:hypothetical protein